jgi:hypothetical protein
MWWKTPFRVVILCGIRTRVHATYNSILSDNAASACDGVVSTSSVSVSTSNYSAGYDSFVGTNVLQEMLYDPNCVDIGCFSDYMSPLITAIFAASVGIIMALFTLILLGLISPCLCSRRCRRWRGWKQASEYKEVRNQMHPIAKRFLWVMFGLLTIGSLTDLILVARNDANMQSSLDKSLCETYRFMNETLNGGSTVIFEDNYGYLVEAQFPGLDNLSDVLANVTELASPNSTLMQSLYELVNVTEPIEVALVNLTSTYATLNTVMGLNAQVEAHWCVFCTNFSYYQVDTFYNHPNHPSVKAINSSLGELITEFRREIVPVINTTAPELYTTLTDIQSSLDSFVGALNTYIYDMILGNIDIFRSVFTYFNIAVIVLLIVSAVPIGFVFWEMKYGSKRPISVLPSLAPFYVTTGFTFFVFLVSGLLVLAAYFAASTCLIFEDMGSVASKISFRFADSSSVADSVAQIAVQCLSKTTNGDILDGIIVDRDSTARDKIDALTLLSAEYDTLHQAAVNGIENAPLAEDIHLVNMGTYLKSVGNVYVVSPKTLERWSTDDRYLEPSSPVLAEVWELAAESTPQCPNRVIETTNTPSGVLEYLSNYTISKTDSEWTLAGINTMNSEYIANNINTGVSTCPSGSYSSLDQIPWGNIQNTKLSVNNYSTFDCDQSTVDQGLDGFYYANATSVNCTFDQYAEYMAGFGDQIIEQAATLDALVEANFDLILNSIWSIIYDDLLAPVQYLGEQLNCQFISARWNGLTAALCGEFTPNLINLGKTMFAMGFVGLFLMIIQFILWRHRVDNYNLWKDAETSRGPQQFSTYSPERIQVTEDTDKHTTISAIITNIEP